MGEPGLRVAAAHVQDPFAKDGCLDQDFDDDGVPDGRALARELLYVAPVDEGHIPAGEHLDAVVGHVEEQVLEVDGFARDVDGENLSLPLPGQLLPIGETAYEDAAAVRRIALANGVRGRLQGLKPEGESENRFPVLLGQSGA